MFAKKQSKSAMMESLCGSFISLDQLKHDERIAKYTNEDERQAMINNMTSIMVQNKLKELNLNEDKIYPTNNEYCQNP